MIEEIYYLDEGYVKISAASVGISSRRWTCIDLLEITNDSHKSLMKENRFDILPIISNGKTIEFFKADQPNRYESISRHIITYKDVLPLDTPIREVIKSFVSDDRSFYFLTYHTQITGLITLGNLNCRQVQVYIFGLICQLERTLSEFTNECLSKEQLETFMTEQSGKNKKFKKIWKHYQQLVKEDLENILTEHLFLIDFFYIIEHFELFNKLGYSINNWDKLKSINEIRNLVAHPTRSLLDKNNDVYKLWERIQNIEDLTFRLNHWKQTLETNDLR